MGETIVYGIKSVLIAVAVGIWTAAIFNITTTVVNFVGTTMSNSLIGEILGVISMCLPFSAKTVFNSIMSAATICIGFVIARKIFSIVMKSNEAT